MGYGENPPNSEWLRGAAIARAVRVKSAMATDRDSKAKVAVSSTVPTPDISLRPAERAKINAGLLLTLGGHAPTQATRHVAPERWAVSSADRPEICEAHSATSSL